MKLLTKLGKTAITEQVMQLLHQQLKEHCLSTHSTALNLGQHGLDDSTLAMMPPGAVTLAQCPTQVC